MKKVLAIDFDDILFDLNGTFTLWHNKTFATSLELQDITHYALNEIYGISNEEMNNRYYQFYETIEHSVTPMIAGAKEAVTELKKEHDLHIVTSRYDRYKKVTLNWLDCYLPQMFTEIHFTNHYETGKRTKSEVCKEIGACLLIDDAAHHVYDATKEGIPALLLDKTWNQNDDIGKAIRVRDWDHALSHLKENGLPR